MLLSVRESCNQVIHSYVWTESTCEQGEFDGSNDQKLWVSLGEAA